ncbi:btaf1 RNA polymerase II, B-TFIID transcription factor-associated, 170kDa [Chytridiales sp. JEL 0842]|nr:btaf1 RNA polymerase II, B-TFIID transcription factor-associated, 170kDa [Chytridiales sp. JEL 0842]
MATRLDRLILLLDTGSTSTVRSTAAQQIGDVQRQHPDELYNLLARVLVHLRSKSWETRVAASQAIDAIARNVPVWDPPPPPPGSSEDSILSDNPMDDEGRLLFDSFDIDAAVRNGSPLLASSGVEYDVDFTNMDPKERIALQKKLLKQSLGQGAEFMKLVDLVSEADLKVEFNKPAPPVKEPALPKQLLEFGGGAKIDDSDPRLAGLSARERNAMKRKLKLEAKNKQSKEKAWVGDISQSSLKKRKSVSDSPIDQQPSLKKLKEEPVDGATTPIKQEDGSDSGKVVVEHKVKEEIAITLGVFGTGDEWPFEGLCEQLCLDLFSPYWEIRHGAALGLREVLKTHGGGAGKILGLSKLTNNERHKNWSEDVAIRLLCVLALDRFADYVGDHVVIPVRETCAQTLSVLLQSCTKDTCLRVVEKGLLKLIQGGEGAQRSVPGSVSSASGGRWEVRHAGLVGLKYWMAVKKDLVADVLVPKAGSKDDTGVYKCILNGLKDRDDDVRSVSSSTLLPISDLLVSLLPPQKIFKQVVTTLWTALEELDDLTAATASVMDLLSQLVMKSEIAAVMQGESSFSLRVQVPRLFPFFRHAMTSVRIAVLRTVGTLVGFASNDSSTDAGSWITEPLLRLVFQNFVLEQKEHLVMQNSQVWTQLLRYLQERQPALLVQTVMPSLTKWFTVLMTPIGTTIDVRQFYHYSSMKSGADSTQNVATHDRVMAQQDLTVVGEASVLRGRIAGSVALGKAIGSLMLQPTDNITKTVQDLLSGYMNSGWANHRVFANLVIEEWGAFYEEYLSHAPNASAATLPEVSPLAATIANSFHQMLATADKGATLLYTELMPFLSRVRSECQALLNTYAEFGAVGSPPLPPLPSSNPPPPPPGPPNPFGLVFTLLVAERFIKEVVPQLTSRVQPGLAFKPTASNPNPPDRLTFLMHRQRRLEAAMESYSQEQTRWEVSTLATASSAVVRLGCLPPKLNPVVRTLMNSIKFEASEQLQRRGADGVGRLFELNVKAGKVGGINDKVVKNLGVFLCADADWGNIQTVSEAEGILGLKMEEKAKDEASGKSSATANGEKSGKGNKKKAGVDGPELVEDLSVVDAGVLVDAAQASKRAHEIVQRGARMAIQNLCQRFGSRVFEDVPKLWEMVSVGLLEFSQEAKSTSKDLDPAAIKCKSDLAFAQNIVDTLQILATVVQALDKSLATTICALLRPICRALRTPLSLVRHAAGQCLAAFAKVFTVETMQAMVAHVVPLLGDASSTVHRQGAAECIYLVAQSLDDSRLLPYIVFLIVPVLGRMSDPDEAVRFISTSVFAHLVKLVPLESGVPDPEGMDAELVKLKQEERKFMGQLVGSEKVEAFEVPKGINAELRPYQKEGVSWLAFLNRYGLHGILCDDMGLGKTLQSICMLASDHHLRGEKYKSTKSPDAAPTPSLVICPPTLTGHWNQEILQFAGDVLKPMVYVGGPAERHRLRSKIPTVDVVITSYDILRNDIEGLCNFNWNYAILDEGHVIKNGKTKLTKAVKSLKCMKRLILSGTPIQNNVLELWSLFDFLMPGFLGTEQQFNQKFGKPILASRDAKSSSREQERGALALEALHRQVLPFLLRRMKEDVLDDLPPKIIQDYYVELSDLQKKLYEDFGKTQAAQTAKQELVVATGGKAAGKAGGDGMGTHVFQALQYLRKLCNHPSLVLKPEHPRYGTVMADLKAEGSSLNDIKHAPKITALGQILQDCGIGVESQDTAATAPHRALVFVQLRDMLDHIENNLFKAQMPGVSYLRMDGSTEAHLRHDMVKRFNSDPSIDVFLLTTSVGGLGLNLTGADTVIFVEHDWNPMKDLQAMDRAHRIGQKRVVNVYRLITKGTLEEKIMGLQKFKLNIASSIINQDNAGIGSMETDQILDLFSVGGDSDVAKSAEAGSQGDANKKATMKEVLEGLDQLWDEKQYESFENIQGFVDSLK